MSSPTPKVLIVSADAGGGHRSAALALEHSLLTLNPAVGVRIIRPFEESNAILRGAIGSYNYVLRHHQGCMKYYYWAMNTFRPTEWRILFPIASRYGREVLAGSSPSIIVAVHPMALHFLGHMLRELRLAETIPFVTVVTDPFYGFWRAWACPAVGKYYVASDAAKRQLVEYGVAPEKIRALGMCIHSKFQPVSQDARLTIRKAIGLAPSKFTVFINAGWIGGGNIPRIFKALLGAELDIQVVFVAGRNQGLFEKACDWSKKATFPVKTIGLTDQMEKVMNASDVMVSKLGGLTTFEALACQLPIIADTTTPPMPQEAQTAGFLRDNGAGLLLEDPEAIGSVIQSILKSPERLETMRKATRGCGNRGGAVEIARDLLSLAQDDTPAAGGARTIRRHSAQD